MLRGIRSRLTYANVTATLAVFIALGGASYAAINLPKNSVGAKQIKANAVGTPEAKNNALTGKDIKEATLGQVPRARSASGAQNADLLDNLDSADYLRSNAAAGGDLAGTYPSPSLRTAEGWHVVPEAQVSTAPEAFYCFAPGAFGCLYGWRNSDASDDNPAGYYKDRAGVVHLRGAVKLNFTCGTSPCLNPDQAQIFTVPPGYRPEHMEAQAVPRQSGGGSNLVGVMHIHPDGRVVQGVGVDNQDVLWLDGITFRCAPSGVNACP